MVFLTLSRNNEGTLSVFSVAKTENKKLKCSSVVGKLKRNYE